MDEETKTDLIVIETGMEIGLVANDLASQFAFNDLRKRKSANTLLAHKKDLGLLSLYLHAKGLWIDDLDTNPKSWEKVTWGLITGFREWMLFQGYAVNSVNRALGTIRTYAGKAFESGVINERECALIQTVRGYAHKEVKHVNENRDQSRRGLKKDVHVTLTADQVKTLKTSHPNTPQGRRNRLLMCLLLDLGLRVGEVALLQVSDVIEKNSQINFYRPKVSMQQTLKLPPDLKSAMGAYFRKNDALASGHLLRQSLSSGEVSGDRITEDGIRKLVRDLGRELIGVQNLSPHDCRHNWATRFARKHPNNPFALLDAGGWKSIATAQRYIEAAKYANDGQDIWGDEED